MPTPGEGECTQLTTMSWQQQASLTGACSTNFGIPPPNYHVMTHYALDVDHVQGGGGGARLATMYWPWQWPHNRQGDLGKWWWRELGDKYLQQNQRRAIIYDTSIFLAL